MLSRNQYEILKESFNEVVSPGIQHGMIKMQVGDMWLLPTQAGTIAFLPPVSGRKVFPQSWKEIDKEGKLSHDDVVELYDNLHKRNFI